MLNTTQTNYQLCIQITDSHLFGNPNDKLLNVPTQATLDKTLELIRSNHESIDVLVATGDISHDQSLESYELFKKKLDNLQAPSLWTPGNHDNFSTIQSLPHFKQHLLNSYDLGDHWRVIMLNSQVENQTYGIIDQEQIDFLVDSLKSSQRFHLICLHHPPFASSARWLNSINLHYAPELLACLQSFLNANVILCGHIHQVVEYYYRGTYLLSTPSTSVQFAPDCTDFKIDQQAPGYRWLKLYDDGQIDTGVNRIQLNDNELSVDLNASYY